MAWFLPEELVVEIFSWLPVQSLVRFTCVSKSCKSLISDSAFVKLHLHRSSSRNADFAHHRLLISYEVDDFRRPYISSRSVTSLLETHPATTVVTAAGCLTEYCRIGTCNGLISLCKLQFDYAIRKYCSLLCFWNPATRTLPQFAPPLYAFGRFGFGYDCSTDTYKVVAVIGSQSPETMAVNVYNMGDTCWRRIQVSPLPCLHMGDAAVFVSNTLNWLATLDIIPWNASTEAINIDPYTIVSFQLGKEELTQLSLPYCPPCGRNEFHNFVPILGVLRDSLCVSQNDKKTRNFVVWQMKEFGVHKSWTQLFNIIGDDNFFSWPRFATCLSENGDALLLSTYGGSQAILYIGRDHKLVDTKIANDIVGCSFTNYIESLVSPVKCQMLLCNNILAENI